VPSLILWRVFASDLVAFFALTASVTLHSTVIFSALFPSADQCSQHTPLFPAVLRHAFVRAPVLCQAAQIVRALLLVCVDVCVCVCVCGPVSVFLFVSVSFPVAVSVFTSVCLCLFLCQCLPCVCVDLCVCVSVCVRLWS